MAPTSRTTSDRIRIVDSFAELIATRFAGDINAICWPRRLPGDFGEIAAQFATEDGMCAIGDADLRGLALSAAGATAREVLLADLAMFRGAGLDPMLDCITGYATDPTSGPVATDVHSFHVDSAPVEADTYLCTYVGSPSEGLANEMAVRRIDVAETRAALLQSYGGPDGAEFDAYLRERCLDLHYAPRPGAEPYSFGVGNLWRIAIAYPGCPVLPCIHRAPLTPRNAPARLLLIS